MKRLAATLILMGGAGCLLVPVVHSLRTTAALNGSQPVAVANAYYERLECYRASVHRLVPEGTTVYVGPASSDAQLLVEASAGWAVVETDAARARLHLALVTSRGGCGDTRVEVRARR